MGVTNVIVIFEAYDHECMQNWNLVIASYALIHYRDCKASIIKTNWEYLRL